MVRKQNTEIERKFLVKTLPDLSNLKPIRYERHYLNKDTGLEKRIQKKGDNYELEELQSELGLSRVKFKKEITLKEFEQLKKQAREAIIRDSYQISDNPQVSIKIYHGRFEGLIRVEVEFSSEEQAKDFQPLQWFGLEITDTPLARDSSLLGLSNEHLKKLLSSFH